MTSMRKVPDDLREALKTYGRLGNWDKVAEHYQCSRSTLKNAMVHYLHEYGYNSAVQAIWYEFVEDENART